MKLQQYLTEKQIIVGKGASYGQIVFLAGGAGSGKGFAATNFLEKSKFKVRDVDELKKSAIKLAKFKGDNPEIANVDLSKPDDVFRLHQYVKDKKWKDETFELLMAGARTGKLPNILFDVTMKDIGDIKEVMPLLIETGYKAENVHVVWVLTDFYIAVQQNAERERRVPYEILLKTHIGAANTVTDMLRGKFGVIGHSVNGEIYVILGGHKNTVLMTVDDTAETIKGKDKFTQLPGAPIVRKGKFSKEEEFVIKSFKYIKLKDAGKPMKASIDFENEMLGWDELRNFIKNNIPKTADTRNIRRRKRI